MKLRCAVSSGRTGEANSHRSKKTEHHMKPKQLNEKNLKTNNSVASHCADRLPLFFKDRYFSVREMNVWRLWSRSFFSATLLVSISDPDVAGVTAALAALLPVVGSFMTPGWDWHNAGSVWPISHRDTNYQSHAKHNAGSDIWGGTSAWHEWRDAAKSKE